MIKRSRRKSSLGAWVLATESPLFLLNAKRKVLFFNKGCEILSGWSAEDVVGKICDYVTEVDLTDIESITGRLCPPAEVFDGVVRSVPAYFAHRDGASHARLIHFFPLVDSHGAVESVLGMITEINQPIQVTVPTITDQLHAEFASLRLKLRQQYQFKQFLGDCDAMQRVSRQVRNASTSTTPLLLQGGTGTGKQFIARLLHQEGANHQQAFVPFECSQLPPRELLRSLKRLIETDSKNSSLPIARQPSTIYFADIDCMTRDVQQFLIDNKQYFSSDNSALRLLAGTTQSLHQQLEEEKTLPEFYYLITTQEITLPPLRSRKGDLKLLAQHFLEQQNRGQEQQINKFDAAVLHQFEQYNWLGNLQELKTVIQEAREHCQSSTIQVTDLPFRFQTGRDAQAISPPSASTITPLETLLEQHERTAIQHALQVANNNKTIAAELLQISRPKLYHRIEALGVESDEK